MVHNPLLGRVGGDRGAALDLASQFIGTRHSIIIVGATPIDGCGIDIGVVVAGKAKLLLVGSELVPGLFAVGGVLKAAAGTSVAESVGAGTAGVPFLQLTPVAQTRGGDVGVGLEGGSGAFSGVSNGV